MGAAPSRPGADAAQGSAQGLPGADPSVKAAETEPEQPTAPSSHVGENSDELRQFWSCYMHARGYRESNFRIEDKLPAPVRDVVLDVGERMQTFFNVKPKDRDDEP
ncbi:Hypothetical Protein FCC1311_042392 [Hondaea fermentalgiana]|uniref:Uncharacterized protein n=1 Tax=Hondaea fermentalgiana TaxID=2315210 RepID=A0A2R5GAF9_9STRA|nr:Hypothetical Protein FCC1311_042392 [Hondaea fermentalgiana]|eukprot:GBG28016.1 Hypothetical Protein FCC1311_042392 [Hondaea fermentalgiana]